MECNCEDFSNKFYSDLVIRPFAGEHLQKGVSLRVIGSSETGLGVANSDLDLVLRLPFEVCFSFFYSVHLFQ